MKWQIRKGLPVLLVCLGYVCDLSGSFSSYLLWIWSYKVMVITRKITTILEGRVSLLLEVSYLSGLLFSSTICEVIWDQCWCMCEHSYGCLHVWRSLCHHPRSYLFPFQHLYLSFGMVTTKIDSLELSLPWCFYSTVTACLSSKYSGLETDLQGWYVNQLHYHPQEHPWGGSDTPGRKRWPTAPPTYNLWHVQGHYGGKVLSAVSQNWFRQL